MHDFEHPFNYDVASILKIIFYRMLFYIMMIFKSPKPGFHSQGH